LPELDEDVLFKFSNGNWGRFSLRILRLNSIIPATHWMKILQPEEMKNQKQEQ
jgi:hypothetical protein